MTHRLVLARVVLAASAAALATAAAAQPVSSPLGALGRTNEAVGAVDQASSEAAAPAADAGLVAPSPAPDADDAEGGDDVRGISYDPEGRRDPFRALTGEAADTEARKKFEGTLKGRLLNEVKLTSILKHPAGNIATFEGGPKKEGYFARAGSEFWDAEVVRVDADSLLVVVRQKVDDPRSIKQWRDIVIPLWSDEEKKAEGAAAP
jgi:hypothetical protein